MPTALTLAPKTTGALSALMPHTGLFPAAGLYPSASGFSPDTAGTLTLTAKSPGALTLTPNS